MLNASKSAIASASGGALYSDPKKPAASSTAAAAASPRELGWQAQLSHQVSRSWAEAVNLVYPRYGSRTSPTTRQPESPTSTLQRYDTIDHRVLGVVKDPLRNYERNIDAMLIRLQWLEDSEAIRFDVPIAPVGDLDKGYNYTA